MTGWSRARAMTGSTAGTGNDTWAGYRGAATVAQVINLNTVSDLGQWRKCAQYRGSDTSHHRVAALTVSRAMQPSGLRDVIATGAGNELWGFLRIGGADEEEGGFGADRLEVTVSAPSTWIWLTNLGSGAGGHTGTFNGDASERHRLYRHRQYRLRRLRGGADIINTGGGADLLSGGGGNDLLNGGGGNDKLFGGAGNDRLIAGFGNDRLTGNAGVDWFEYDRLIRQGSDIITDFTNGADRIRIAGGSMADVAISSVDSGLDTRIVLDSGCHRAGRRGAQHDQQCRFPVQLTLMRRVRQVPPAVLPALDDPCALREDRASVRGSQLLVERVVRNDEVRGSIPLCSTKPTRTTRREAGFFYIRERASAATQSAHADSSLHDVLE